MEFLDLILTNKEFIWLFKIMLVVVLAIFLSYASNKILDRLQRKLARNNKQLDNIIIYCLRKPIRILIWILALALSIDLSNQYSKTDLFYISVAIKDLGLIFAVAWGAWRFIKKYEAKLINQKINKKVDITTASAVIKLLKASLIITVCLIILQTLGIGIGGVLAFGGVGGIAIGFAARDLLANFFGAIMLYMDRPFVVGDWIRSPDKEIEGVVEQIGWRLTTIRTFDKRKLYVPNSVFSSIALENPSRMTNRRIYETIGLRYDDVNKVDVILSQIQEMLENHEEIDNKQTLMVNLNKFSEYSVDFFIYSFTKTTNWVKFHRIKQGILLEISRIISDNKAEMAFPTSVVDINKIPKNT